MDASRSPLVFFWLALAIIAFAAAVVGAIRYVRAASPGVPSSSPLRGGDRGYRLGVGVAAAVAVFSTIAFAMLVRPVSYAANADVVITPLSTGAELEAADSVSQGTTVGTVAFALGTTSTQEAAMASAGLPFDPSDVDVTTEAVEGTSGIRIEATSANPVAAELVADAVADYRPELGGLSRVYEAEVVQEAAGRAFVAGNPGPLGYSVMAIVAALVGMLLFAGLGRLRRVVALPIRPRSLDASGVEAWLARSRTQEASAGEWPGRRSRDGRRVRRRESVGDPTAGS